MDGSNRFSRPEIPSNEPSKERTNGDIFDTDKLIEEGNTSSTKCTSKLAGIIKNMKENKPDIITIVEATDYTKEIFIDHIYDNDDTKYTLFEHTEEVAKVIIIINKEYQDEYNFEKLFGMNLAEDDYRPLLVLYSKEKEILLLCAHFPNKRMETFIQIDEFYNKIFYNIEEEIKKYNITNIQNIVFSGDFNDHYGSLIRKYIKKEEEKPSITILGKKLYMGDGKNDIPITCCYPRRLLFESQKAYVSGNTIKAQGLFDRRKEKEFIQEREEAIKWNSNELSKKEFSGGGKTTWDTDEENETVFDGENENTETFLTGKNNWNSNELPKKPPKGGYHMYADYIFSTYEQTTFNTLDKFTNKYISAIEEYTLKNFSKSNKYIPLHKRIPQELQNKNISTELEGDKVGADHEPIISTFANDEFPTLMHINLSWATQLNIEAGTEIDFVKDCKRSESVDSPFYKKLSEKQSLYKKIHEVVGYCKLFYPFTLTSKEDSTKEKLGNIEIEVEEEEVESEEVKTEVEPKEEKEKEDSNKQELGTIPIVNIFIYLDYTISNDYKEKHFTENFDNYKNLFITILYYNIKYNIIQKIAGSETEYNTTMISYPVFIIKNFLDFPEKYKDTPPILETNIDLNLDEIHQDFLRIMGEMNKNIVSHAFLEDNTKKNTEKNRKIIGGNNTNIKNNTFHTISNLHHIDNIRYSGYPILPIQDILNVEKEKIWETWREKKEDISIINQENINKAFDRWRKGKTIEKTDGTQWVGQLDHEYYTKDCFIFFYLQRIRELYNFCYDKNGKLIIEDDNFYYIYTLLNEIDFEENKELFPEIDDINNFENIIEKLKEKSKDIQKKYKSITNVFQDLIVLYQIYRDEYYWKKGDNGEFVKRDFVIGYHKLDIRKEIQKIMPLFPKKVYNTFNKKGGNKTIIGENIFSIYINKHKKNLLYNATKKEPGEVESGEKNLFYNTRNEEPEEVEPKEVEPEEVEPKEVEPEEVESKEKNLFYNAQNEEPEEVEPKEKNLFYNAQNEEPEEVEPKEEKERKEQNEKDKLMICPTTLDIEKLKEILDYLKNQQENQQEIDKFIIIIKQKIKDLYDILPEKPEKENIPFFAINLIFEYFIDRIANITKFGDCDYKDDELPNKECTYHSDSNKRILSKDCDEDNFKYYKEILNFIYPNDVEKIKKEQHKITQYSFSFLRKFYGSCKKYFRISFFYRNIKKNSSLIDWSILINKYATATTIKNREIPFPFMFILPKDESIFPKNPLKKKYNEIYTETKKLYSITVISYINKNKMDFQNLFFLKNQKKIDHRWSKEYKSYFDIIDNSRRPIEQGFLFPRKNITYDEFNSLVRYYKCNVFLYIGEEDIQDNHILCITLYNKEELFTYFYDKKLYSTFEEFSKDFDKMFIQIPYIITEPKRIYVSGLPGRKFYFTQSIELQNENIKNFLEGKISRIKFLELEQLTREQQLQVQTGGGKKQIQLFQDTFTLFHKSNLLKRNSDFFDYMHTYYKLLLNIKKIQLNSIYFEKYNYITEKFFRTNIQISLKKAILEFTINNSYVYFTTELCHTFPFINSSTNNILELSSNVQPSFLHTILHKYPDKNYHLQQYFMPKYTYSDNFLKQIEILQTLEKATRYNITTIDSYITKEFITSKSTKQDIIYNHLSNNTTNITPRVIEHMNTQLHFSIFLFALHHLQLGGHYIFYIQISQTKATADLCLLGKMCFEKVHLYRIKCQNIYKQSGVYIIFYNYQGISDSRKKELLDIFDTLYTYDPTGGEIYNLHEEKYRSTGNNEKNTQNEKYYITKPLIPGFIYKYIYEFLAIPEDSKEYDFIREFNDIWFTKRIRHYKMLIDIKQSPEKVQEFLKEKFTTAQVVSSILWAKEFGMKLDTGVDLVNDFHKYLQEDFHSNQEIILEWKKPTSTKYISPDPNIVEAYTSTMSQQKEYYDMLIEKNTTIDDTDKEIQNIFFQYDLDTNQTFIEKTKKVLENVQKTLGTIKPKGNMIIQIPLPWIQFPEIQLVYQLITSFQHVYFIKPSRYGYGTNFYIVCKNFKKYTKTIEKKTIFPIDFMETYLEHIGILIWNIFYYTHRHQYYQEDSKYISL